MRTFPDCIPCLERHARELAAEHLPEGARGPFIKAVLRSIDAFDMNNPPPVFALLMYDMLRDMAGIYDPYAENKRLFNRKALDLYPRLKDIITGSSDPLDTGLRLAVAGNIIDFGTDAGHGIPIEETIARALHSRFAFDDRQLLFSRLQNAKTVLYIADNAGEIVFDRLFIEAIGPERVICAVRSAPIINDATIQDAEEAGLTDICRVMESGSRASGTLLDLCSPEFRSLFSSADLVISKGQGNFETLEGSGREIFHLLMVKCPVIAREIGAAMGSFIALMRQ